MQDDPAFQSGEDDNVQLILLAASQHDVPGLRRLLHGQSFDLANVRDSDTGSTPLHSAIYACAPERDDKENASGANHDQGEANGVSYAIDSQSSESEDACATVRYLLQKGAIWNQLDNENETPGCVALRLGLRKLYEVMVDAGVRAEMLKNRHDEYKPLNDQDSEDEEATQDTLTAEPSATAPPPASIHLSEELVANASESDAVRSVVNARPDSDGDHGDRTTNSTTEPPLEEHDEIVMAWERHVMANITKALLPQEELRILTIGHGIGALDEFFQQQRPVAHHIIEARTGVLNRLRRNGWLSKTGVKVHQGRWQDIVPTVIAEGHRFNAIYFDTFGEEYKTLRTFFDSFVPSLLQEDGRFSFFNSFGAERQICYDVNAKVLEMDLLESGFDIEWELIKIGEPLTDEMLADAHRPCWRLGEYKLPIITSLE